MKNIIIVFLAVLFLGINNEVHAQSKSFDEFTVQVDGLGCPFCAYGLEKKFKELKGIKKVNIEMETGMMNFLFPAEKALSIEQVEKQVEKAGYTPVSVAVKRADGAVETTETAENEAVDVENLQTISFFVAGNCGMCQARIEKTAKDVTGVEEAEWDKETKMLSVKLGDGISQADIEQAIAKAGHDTKNSKADDEVYSSLPGCCHYDRVK